jgi:hypothetical protein
MTDFIIRFVEGYGYLPMVKAYGKLLYQGDHQVTPEEALSRCIAFQGNECLPVLAEDTFSELKDKEIQEFKDWAKNNFTAGEAISELWHPVVRKECKDINERTFTEFIANLG